MTNGNHVTHNTKHRILINKTKFTPYCVPPAHAPASVLQFRNKHHEYNNFCVQLVQKIQILTKKINIEVLLVAH
jgi:hypothetical protein